MLTGVIHYGIIYTEVKKRPHKGRMLYMTKEIYIGEAKEHLEYAKMLKEEGKYTFTLKMHFMSKLDGMCTIAVKDKDLKPEDYKEVCDAYFNIQGEIWEIGSDAEPEEEL